MHMSLVEDIIRQEKKRIEVMIISYEDQMHKLPKGTLVRKQKGINQYYYFTYRVGKTVVSEYMGKYSERIIELMSQITQRRHLEQMLRELHTEMKIVKKVLEEQ